LQRTVGIYPAIDGSHWRLNRDLEQEEQEEQEKVF
jgi:hypothetical protein